MTTVRELLRHANSRITLDVYTQAVNSNKRAAQSEVVRMMVPNLGEMKDEKHSQNGRQNSYRTHIEPGFRCHFRSIRSVSHLESMAGTTGLEPATSAVTGQRSDQLSYVPTLSLSRLPTSRLVMADPEHQTQLSDSIGVRR